MVCAVFPPEEVTTAGMSYDLALSLSKKNDVTVLRPRPSRPAGVDYSKKNVVFDDFKCITLNSYTCPHSKMLQRFWESMDFGFKSARYIKKHRDEIEYIYNAGWHLFGLYIVSKVAKRYHIPYMVPIQDVYPESLLTKGLNYGIIKKLVKKILFPLDLYTQKNAHIVRTNSVEMASYLSQTRNIPLDKYLIVYNWQNEEDFREITGEKNRKRFVFSYVGSINVHSNVDLIIKAYAKARTDNTEMKVYGGGNQAEACKELAKQLNLDSVSFGFVSRNDVPRIQSKADVMLMALPTGNGRLCMPSKLISYMLSGKPVLASIDTDCEAAKIINESGCGIVVEPDNVDALVAGLKKMTNIPYEKRCAMGIQAREFAQKVLSKDVNLNKVIKAIEDFVCK